LTAWKSNALAAIYDKEHGRKETPALRFGQLVHTAILEPELFASKYIAVDKPDRRTKEGKAAWEKLLGKHGEDSILTLEEKVQIDSIHGAVLAHPKAANLMAQSEIRETTILWTDYETGLECKARIDLMAGTIMADLKTTEDASTLQFGWSLNKYGYHRQGAFYLRACRAAGLNIKHYSIVAVEKEAPFGCNVISVPDTALDQGEREIADLMRQVAFWKANGDVPGYSKEVVSVDLPESVYRRIEAEGA
jgi:exodeoxyribonuclease VIII